MAQRLKTDWTLFFTVVVMTFFGLIMVYSASLPKAELAGRAPTHLVLKQAAITLVAMLFMMALKRIDYRILRDPLWAFGPLGVVLVLLMAAYVADPFHHRWIRFPGFQLQPSELAKPALAIFLAWFVTRRLPAINSKHTMGPAAMVLALLAIMVVSGDMGTMIVLMATAAAVFFVAGMSRRYTMMAFSALAVLAVVAVAMKPYRLSRVVHFVDPDYKIISKFDPNGVIKARIETSLSTRDPNYQARQSVIAVGSGGVLGLGLMQGRQKMLYVPEAHTDFIYSVVGEELGLWGCTGVLTGFLILLWRGLRLFWIAPDDFGRYLALAVTVSLVFQALVNISVVLDLGPTKGMPLPLISFGGTSIISSLISLGLLLSVSERAG